MSQNHQNIKAALEEAQSAIDGYYFFDGALEVVSFMSNPKLYVLGELGEYIWGEWISEEITEPVEAFFNEMKNKTADVIEPVSGEAARIVRASSPTEFQDILLKPDHLAQKAIRNELINLAPEEHRSSFNSVTNVMLAKTNQQTTVALTEIAAHRPELQPFIRTWQRSDGNLEDFARRVVEDQARNQIQTRMTLFQPQSGRLLPPHRIYSYNLISLPSHSKHYCATLIPLLNNQAAQYYLKLKYYHHYHRFRLLSQQHLLGGLHFLLVNQQ